MMKRGSCGPDHYAWLHHDSDAGRSGLGDGLELSQWRLLVLDDPNDGRA